uniref:HNH endonuclease n=1 Tax=viral metagenome TaxID=1070528 RepID=A0A6C0C381_9ZZZZ
MNKHCKRCDETKPHEAFYKNKRRKDGLQVYCKPCMKKENKVNYKKHKESWDKRTKEYNKTDKNKKYRREWATNKYNTNPEHRQKCIDRVVANERKKLDTDPTYKLIHNMRGRLRKAVKGYGDKYDTTMNLVGCNSTKLREYLEAKFTEGMTWENYGQGWHVDHIKPCCSFDLTSEEEQKKCFHYSNLQPLWAEDNLKKGGSYQN